MPVCFALDADTVHITVDGKPKRATGGALKRLRNIVANPQVALVFDRYDEDWTRLAWVMLRGSAEILPAGVEHDAAQSALRRRYPQYASMDLAPLPVIAVRVARAHAWGRLDS